MHHFGRKDEFPRCPEVEARNYKFFKQVEEGVAGNSIGEDRVRRWTRLNRLGSKGRARRRPYGGASKRRSVQTGLMEREGGYPHHVDRHPFHLQPRGRGPHNAGGRCTISGIGSIGDFNGLIGKKGCAALVGFDFLREAFPRRCRVLVHQ
ncbi:hypothetical protein KM043_016549 [Ampulex compressa]|nr:hypothetical protein KM043_016549 [Ampulex compressa]